MRQLLPEMSDEVDLDEAYALPATPTRHVRANLVASVDGAAAVDGSSLPLSGPADRQVFAVLRGLCDVVLVGAGTVRRENYGPVRPSPRRVARRRSAGLADAPPIAVVSASLDLDLGSRFFTEAGSQPLVVTSAAGARRRPEVARSTTVVLAGEDSVDLVTALDALADRGLTRVLCEGGPALLGSLLTTGLLDELCLTVAPCLAGAEGQRVVEGPSLSHPLDCRLAHVLEKDGVLFLRYQTAQPSAGSTPPSEPDPSTSSSAVPVPPGSP